MKPSNTRKCLVAARILYGETCFRNNTTRFSSGSAICTLCNQFCIDDAKHVLFDCDQNENIRCCYWNKVQEAGPSKLISEMQNYSNDKAEFILSCFHSDVVPEWIALYGAVIDYIYNVYIHRQKTSAKSPSS